MTLVVLTFGYIPLKRAGPLPPHRLMTTTPPLLCVLCNRGLLCTALALYVAGVAAAAAVPAPSFGVNGFATWSAEVVPLSINSSARGVSLQADGTAFVSVEGSKVGKGESWLAHVGPSGALVTLVLLTGKVRMPKGMVANHVLQGVWTGSRLYVLALNAR